MKNRNKFLLSILLGVCYSCNSWLDVDLKDQMEEHKLFSSEQGFREALAGVYAKMSQQPMYGGNLTFGVMDVFGQTYDYYRLDNNMLEYAGYDYNAEKAKTMIDGFWKNSYSAISSLNNILNFIVSNGSVMSEQSRDQIKGEILALRAYLHFDLYRMFAPDIKRSPNVKRLPYVKEFGVQKTPFSTNKEFVNLVLQDLQEAEGLLKQDPILSVIPYQLGINEKPEEQTKSEADTYVARMNYWAVEAMMARVFLAMGDMENARIKALDVIAAKQFRLVDYAISLDVEKEDYWDVLFSDEHIFSLKNKVIRTSAEGTLNQQNGLGTNLQVTQEAIIALYPNTEDIRRQYWFNSTNGWIMKYTRKNTNRFTPKVVLIRLSEMYFIVAETYLKENNAGKAKEYIDLLRDSRIRRNSPLPSFSEEDLILEMRSDFIAEGQYFFMYKRLNHKIPTLSVNEIAPSDEIFVFPMPEAEIVNGNR